MMGYRYLISYQWTARSSTPEESFSGGYGDVVIWRARMLRTADDIQSIRAQIQDAVVHDPHVIFPPLASVRVVLMTPFLLASDVEE